MVLGTIIIAFACLLAIVILCVFGTIGISSYKSISLGLAQISESGKNTRERINVRADLASYDGDDHAEQDGAPNELDSIARLLGYDSLGSALADPALLERFNGNKKKGDEKV